MAAVTIHSDFGAPKIKPDTVSIVSPSICHEVMGPDAILQLKKKERKKEKEEEEREKNKS